MIAWRLFSLTLIIFFSDILNAIIIKKKLEPVDEYCQTELHKLARRPNAHIAIAALLADDSDPNQKDLLGNTPLDEACSAGILFNVIYLVFYGASFDDSLIESIRYESIRTFLLELKDESSKNVPFEEALLKALEKVVKIDFEEILSGDGHGLFLVKKR